MLVLVRQLPELLVMSVLARFLVLVSARAKPRSLVAILVKARLLVVSAVAFCLALDPSWVQSLAAQQPVTYWPALPVARLVRWPQGKILGAVRSAAVSAAVFLQRFLVSARRPRPVARLLRLVGRLRPQQLLRRLPFLASQDRMQHKV